MGVVLRFILVVSGAVTVSWGLLAMVAALEPGHNRHVGFSLGGAAVVVGSTLIYIGGTL